VSLSNIGNMLDQALDFFAIKSDVDLNIMKSNQNLYSLTREILIGMKAVLEEFSPDFVFVHGDTTTSMATSLTSFLFWYQSLSY
jgi:UDP-N-acetylglucosamine 2-epimerase (non-hydrolysing)